MNTRSLKFRLVAWYTGSLTVLVVAFGFFNYISLRHEMERGLGDALARRARHVALAVQRSAPNWQALAAEVHSRFTPELNNRLSRVTVNGVAKYVSGAPEDRSFDPSTVPAAPEATSTSESFARRTLPDGTQLYIVVLPLALKGDSVLIEDGSSAQPIDHALQTRMEALVVGGTLLIVVAAAGGFLLLQHALGPVDQIIKSAENISSRDLGERLPVPNTGDELERLSVSLNHMIRRLEEAVQQNRRFLADASHELRTPLAVLQVELESVLEGRTSSREPRDVAASALEEVERLRKIVETLFALSRLDAGEAQEECLPVDLGEMASTIADQMSLLAEDKRISIECRCPPGTVVNGDRARLKQVVVNLLDNAIKYTTEGGKVQIAVLSRDGKAVLEVADNGIGIPSHALDHVFDRFFRVDKARSRGLGGAGLGLSIVKSICAAHQGYVRVQSEEGKGSRFIVELPLHETCGMALAEMQV